MHRYTQLLCDVGLPPHLLMPDVPVDTLTIANSRSSSTLHVRTPIDGSTIGQLSIDTPDDIALKIQRATDAFVQWRRVPPPMRGELVRQFAARVRRDKLALGTLVTIESGKTLDEGCGEVQEVIDICDFAAGLSRQLYGLTIASERPRHHLLERWHPLGPVAVITAFNFPMAVWAWNAMLALVCGDTVLWKPSEKTPLCALALQRLLSEVITDASAPEALSQIIIGGRKAGEQLADDHRIALVSATGSTVMGRDVGVRVSARLGRTLLELGGNNAAIVASSANIELAIRAIVFSAAGTSGQRCTTLRRLFIHQDIYDGMLTKLKRAYASLPIGDPLVAGTLIGPLIDSTAFGKMQESLAIARKAGARITGGERVYPTDVSTEQRSNDAQSFYVRPALVELTAHIEIAREETFAPILYVFSYQTFAQAIALQNNVPQGLSSAVFTSQMHESETFLSAEGSDCGIANVNTSTSGAEIGGAFGGEKETGGGRESGSDAWKAYMRRQTQTVNFSESLPLAQGVRFDSE